MTSATPGSPGTPRMLTYDVVDVFTDRAFAGNPLAVVHGAEDLSDAQMLAVAREFNLSETTFPSNGVGESDYAVRIFTPGGEVPFAGHPTLGTAWVLRQYERIASGTVVQRCGVGDIEVEVPAGEADPVRLSAAPRDLAGPIAADKVAEAVGLPASLVTGDVLAAGCGLTWVHLPVAAEALERCRPGGDLEDALADIDGLQDPVGGVNVHTVSSDAEGLQVRSRVFCPDVGVVEDPATGSAAVGLGVALVAGGVLPDGGTYTIRQGVEMGRPSTLHGQVEAADRRAIRCRVSGGVVAVASGSIAVPSG
ncbi:MAG: PhzF family phenazine biosynthesis protein [Nocardioidaceae bacterium]